LRVQLTPRLWLCAAALLTAIFAKPASADEVTGTWSGSLEGRPNYYWERSTRVIPPAGKVKLVTPTGVRFGADYLLDVISSASIAQTGSDEDRVHVELRHGIGAEFGKEFDFGDVQLDLGVHGTYSTETDWRSMLGGVSSIVSFNEKNTRVRFSASHNADTVYSNADPDFEEPLTGLVLSTGIEQVVNPVLVVSLGYQFGYLNGWLGNPYRRALIGPLPVRERPPDERLRHTITSRLAWYLPATETAIHIMQNLYADDWGVAAINPELRVYQQVGRDLLLRPRYRFYAQTAASFYRAPYPAGWDGPTTNDPKMAEFTTHTIGLSVEYRLSLLTGGALDFARGTWLDISFDRYISTNAFGSGVIGTAGGRIEF
jgi:hypothetical protein